MFVVALPQDSGSVSTWVLRMQLQRVPLLCTVRYSLLLLTYILTSARRAVEKEILSFEAI